MDLWIASRSLPAEAGSHAARGDLPLRPQRLRRIDPGSVGASVGVLAAFVALSLLSTAMRLREISVVDGAAFAAAVGVVVLATVLAAYQPARLYSRQAEALSAAVARPPANLVELLRIADGVGAQDVGVDDRERDREESDADRQRQHRSHQKCAAAAQTTHAVAEILGELFEEGSHRLPSGTVPRCVLPLTG